MSKEQVLAEPTPTCLQCWALGELRKIDQRKNDEVQSELREVYGELHKTRTEVDRLKKKLEIATRTLNVIAFYCSSNDELVVGYATEAIVNMSKLDRE